MPIEDAFVEPAFAGSAEFGAGFGDGIGVIGEERDPSVAVFAIIFGGQTGKTFLEREQGALVVNEDVATPHEPQDFAGGGEDVAMISDLEFGG